MIKKFSSIFKLQNQILRQNRNLLKNTPKFNFFGLGKKESKKNVAQQKSEALNSQYQEFLEEQRFNIRKPFEQNHFISEEEKKKQRDEAKRELKNYLDVHKFDDKFDETAFSTLLSKISYTFDNQAILENKEFQELLVKTAEITILGNINDRNYHEMGLFFELFENPLLQSVRISNQKIDFQRLQDIITIYRNYDKGTQNFFYTLEQIIKENVNDETAIPHLITLTRHYAGSIKERITTRNEMMTLFENILLKKIRFLNNHELIQIYFAYAKFGKGSDLFFEALDDRVVLQIDSMTVNEAKQIMIIAQNRPESREKIFIAAEGYVRLNIAKIPKSMIPEFFFYFSENSLGSADFYKMMETKLIESIFLMTPELLSLCAWSFAVNHQTFKANLFYQKMEECLPNVIQQASVKDLCRIVWSLCKVMRSDDNEIMQTIEAELQRKNLSGKDCAQILWGYILNAPLEMKTLEKIINTIMEQKEELDNWDVSTIVWSFSKFESHQQFKFIFEELHEQSVELIDEMTPEEYFQVLRAYVDTQNESEELIQKIKEQMEHDFYSLQYDQLVMCMHYFTNLTNVEISEELKQFIIKIKKRSEELVKLTVQGQDMPINEDNYNLGENQTHKVDISDVDYYLKNEKLKSLKE